MGADTFFSRASGKSAQEAFRSAVEDAQYESGHGGYSGTIAEKGDFVMITLPEGRKAFEFADELIDAGDDRIDDKWGPAGCIALGAPKGAKDDTVGEYLFFGWASC